MNKDYYNKLIEEEIKYLLEKKEDLCREITEIATTFEYHSLEDDISLGRLETSVYEKENGEKYRITSVVAEKVSFLSSCRN